MDTEDYLYNLPEKTPVAVNVPITSGGLTKHNAIAVVADAPVVELLFPPGSLPEAGRVDTSSDCLVFIETGEIVTLICTIEEIEGRDMIRVRVRDVIQHVEKREFFRGPADRLQISIRRKSLPGGPSISAVRGINVSCGGMLMILNQEMGKKEKLELEISVPEPVKKTIKCDAVVLRVKRERRNAFFVAVKFAGLDSEACDDIMAYCFAEQRRLLREQVITRDL